MARFGRLLILGSLTVGLLLTVAFAFGSGKIGRAFGATGYGTDTVPPSQLATSSSTSSDGGSSSTGLLVGVGVGGAIVLGTGGAVFWKKVHP